MNDAFDLLGAETPITPKVMTWMRGALALGTGILGAVLIPKHPVLAFLNGAALASNVHAVATGDRKLADAGKRMGRHIVATASSLALPKYPAIGYVAGAIAADMLIDGEGGGIIEEWADYEGIRSLPKKEASNQKIVDAEFTESQPKVVRT
jgi:hypothetical protein